MKTDVTAKPKFAVFVRFLPLHISIQNRFLQFSVEKLIRLQQYFPCSTDKINNLESIINGNKKQLKSECKYEYSTCTVHDANGSIIWLDRQRPSCSSYHTLQSFTLERCTSATEVRYKLNCCKFHL